MCGIAGYLSTDGAPVPKEPIEFMLTVLRHRGPDGFGVFSGERCVLGHARLSIIDLSGGWQPIFNEDGRLAVTYNGEIYNYVELRRDLEARGHLFYTRSDTEVIVHAYEEWGTDCPSRFNGQFALAVYDTADRSLFLARDRLGVRPLYYGWSGKRFVFASEAKALFASGFIEPELSADGLHQIFTLWTNAFPSTPFTNIRELPPAHTMRVAGEGLSLRRYWELPAGREERLSPEECDEGVLDHLNRSIRLRLRADVPVAAYLSGGLDSALTTTLIRRWTDAPLKTFSLEFEDPRFDEADYQIEMVRFLGTDHASVRCGPNDIVACFEKTIWATERPLLRTAPAPMFLLSGLVRSEGYKVVITGEGADELFLGYDIFKETKIREFCSRTPGSRLRPLLLRRLYPYLFGDPRTARFQEAFFLRRYLETGDPFYGQRIRWDQARRIRDFYSPDFLGRIGEDPEAALLENLPRHFSRLSPMKRAQLAEIETLLSSYLLSSQGDRVAMAHSVEGRFVFLDHELIEFAARIPETTLISGLREKSVLKRIGRSMLPPRIIERKKFPYRAPDVESFLSTQAGRYFLSRNLATERVRESGIFDAVKVTDLLRKVLDGPNGTVATSDNLVLMAALSGQVFSRTFFNSPVEKQRFDDGHHVRIAVEGETKWLKHP